MIPARFPRRIPRLFWAHSPDVLKGRRSSQRVVLETLFPWRRIRIFLKCNRFFYKLLWLFSWFESLSQKIAFA